MKKTKIICTIGPASEDKEILKEMMLSGMNAARLNFSHGTYAEQKRKIDLVKQIRQELGLHIALILDTKGPEIRTGRFQEGQIRLEKGQRFTLTTKEVLGTESICSITYKDLPMDVKPGDRILIDDGLVGLTVDNANDIDVVCTVDNGGLVKDHKGINIPGVEVKLPPLTVQDKKDIIFGIQGEVDFIAASFVRRASDVLEIRNLIAEHGAGHIKIIAKIENKEGIDNIEEIIDVSDGIMVARGDLGVEIPAEQVPLMQKKIIKLCNKVGKPVITATQMLDSMIRNPRPTRAEVTDVANAIFDGTDAVMLSGETAAGKYPAEAVQQMEAIISATEKAIDYEAILHEKSSVKNSSITNAIGHATCTSAQGLNAAAILTPTTSGYTASVVSKFRPQAPILAFTSSEHVARHLSLVWGVTPLVKKHEESAADIFKEAINTSLTKGFLKKDDLIIITAGVPVGIGGTTNMMRIHVVGKEI